MAHIQIVEDDADIAEILRFNLEHAGHEVTWADNGDDGMADMRTRLPDLVILDWMLPDTSGINIARQLRRDEASATLPIIMLTARTEEDDHVKGFEVGADDYVTKPFSVPELMARVKSQLRRHAPVPSTAKFGDIMIEPEKMRVTRGARPVRLGPKEFDVLMMLTRRAGRVYSREDILDRVWGIDGDVETRTVDVVVGRLRRALNRGRDVDPIRTVRGVGYAWDA